MEKSLKVPDTSSDPVVQDAVKVTRLDFLRGIPPKFERRLHWRE